jgi:hypothetical protein
MAEFQLGSCEQGQEVHIPWKDAQPICGEMSGIVGAVCEQSRFDERIES